MRRYDICPNCGGQLYVTRYRMECRTPVTPQGTFDTAADGTVVAERLECGSCEYLYYGFEGVTPVVQPDVRDGGMVYDDGYDVDMEYDRMTEDKYLEALERDEDGAP